MNRQTPDDLSEKTRRPKLAWLGLGSITCAVAAMTAAFFSASDPKIAIDAARIDASAALARSGFSWAQVEIENRVAVIRGEAPGEPERVMAYEVVNKALRPAISENKVITKVRSQLTLAAPPAPIAVPEPEVPVAAIVPPPAAAAREQSVAAMETSMQPNAAPAASWVAPPVQFPNGQPTITAEVVTPAAVTSPATIETSSVDKSAASGQSACKDEFAATLAHSIIVFASDSATIDKQSRPVLDKLAGIAKRCSRLHLAIEGHTDGNGAKSHNQALSQRRAEAVRTALVNRGIDMDHISARGLGSSRPIEQGTSERAQARNRRIEFAVSERAVLERKAAAQATRTRSTNNEPTKN